MCLNCGCGDANARHDNEANITADDVRRAAEANGQDMSTTLRNMQDSIGAVRSEEMTASGAGSRDMPR